MYKNLSLAALLAATLFLGIAPQASANTIPCAVFEAGSAFLECDDGATCDVWIGTCAGNGDCDVGAGACSGDGDCDTAFGTCTSDGNCDAFAGTCSSGGQCSLMVGTCAYGDCTVFVGLCNGGCDWGSVLCSGGNCFDTHGICSSGAQCTTATVGLCSGYGSACGLFVGACVGGGDCDAYVGVCGHDGNCNVGAGICGTIYICGARISDDMLASKDVATDSDAENDIDCPSGVTV